MRQPSSYLVIAAALAALAAAGCASMQQRVTESENRVNTTDAQVADLLSTQQSIINTLTVLRADLEAATDPAGAAQSRGVDLAALQAAVDSLQEQVGILTTQLAAYEAAGQISASASVPTTEPAATRGGASNESAQDSLFNSAYRDYTAAQYVLAISGFEEYLGRYPDADRAPDALYWIAESLAAQGEHGDARRRFLEVPSRYPGSAKVPDAVLRAALEAIELGQIGDATRELRQLVAAHASSDAALIGCMQLDRLGQTLPSGCRLP